MKKNRIISLGACSILAATLVFFQNCQKANFDAVEGSGTLSSSLNAGASSPDPTSAQEPSTLTCGSHALNEVWDRLTNQLITEASVCANGGNLTSNYQKLEQVRCVNGVEQVTGVTSKGSLVSTAGACAPATCDGRVDGSTWSLQEGTVSESVACVDTPSVQVQNIYQIRTQYRCQSGTSVKISSGKAELLGTTGTCPAPAVSASLEKTEVAVGETVRLLVTTANVSVASYSCTNGYTGNLQIGSASVSLQVKEDFSCTVSGRNSAGETVSKSVQASVKCAVADQIYQNGTCKAFQCLQYTEIKNWPAQIPARDGTGTCYYAKIFDPIANRNSSGSRLTGVISRDHNGNSTTSNPYILGTASRQFTMQAHRAVKLSGSQNSLDPILVDNYLLIGKRLSTTTAAANAWTAYGSGDSTIPGKTYIQVNSQNVTLNSFGSSGTATIAALLLTDSFQPLISYILDINALDCGGLAALSSIYMVFQ